jgi:hypothetical protein
MGQDGECTLNALSSGPSTLPLSGYIFDSSGHDTTRVSCPLSVADVLGQENLTVPSTGCNIRTHHDTAGMVTKGKVLVAWFRLDATT